MSSKSIVSKEVLAQLEKVLGKAEVYVDEPMKKHTTVRVGGNADVLVRPSNIEQVIQVINIAKENDIKYTVIGNGSKLLIKDGGIRGIVIKFMNNMSQYNIHENIVTANAGVSLPLLAVKCKESGLTGLEFACGIPASLGGAVYMNAGAYNSEMANVVKETTYLDEAGNIVVINKEQHQFGYRQSLFKYMAEVEHKRNIILESKLELKYGDISEITDLMYRNKNARMEKQPLEYASAGSTFKRPEGHFVGKLIDDAGLKGYRVGDAQVSMKHSGFIVNLGNATASDFLQVIQHIKEVVLSKFNIKLEEEIEVLGEDL